jgi:hypothetical protein
MRVFNIGDVVTCALSDNSRPDLSKQSKNQPHYALKVFENCENGKSSISIDLLKSTIKNLNVLCLQKSTGQNQVKLIPTVKTEPFGIITRTALAKTKKKVMTTAKQMVKPYIPGNSKKARFKNPKKYLLKYKFNISNSDSSFPIFLFYQLEESKQLTQDLVKLLNDYCRKLDANLIKNLSLSKTVCQNEDQVKQIDKDPHLKILDIVVDIFNEIEQLSVSILGIFLDPYFISKRDNKLIAQHVVDKRCSQIVEIPVGDTGGQQEFCSSTEDTELLLSSIETNEYNIGSAELQSLSSEGSVIISSDSDSMESNSNAPEILSFLKEKINLVDDVQIAEEVDKPSNIIVPTTNRQVSEEIIASSQSNYIQVASAENRAEDWNPETKKK